MDQTFTIGEAKTQLSKLVAPAERGEEVELWRGKDTRRPALTAGDSGRRLRHGGTAAIPTDGPAIARSVGG